MGGCCKGLRTAWLTSALIALFLGASGGAGWSATFPAKPAAGSFIVDEAGLIGSADAGAINRAATALLKDQQIPLFVVTLSGLARHGGAGLGIEGYGLALFDAWGIGSQDHNYGILLLVSVAERQIRVELGADWAGRYDAEARDVVYEIIKPQFKRGRFSAGLLDGVRGLDAMARDRTDAVTDQASKPASGSGSGLVFGGVLFAVVFAFGWLGRSNAIRSVSSMATGDRSHRMAPDDERFRRGAWGGGGRKSSGGALMAWLTSANGNDHDHDDDDGFERSRWLTSSRSSSWRSSARDDKPRVRWSSGSSGSWGSSSRSSFGGGSGGGGGSTGSW